MNGPQPSMCVFELNRESSTVPSNPIGFEQPDKTRATLQPSNILLKIWCHHLNLKKIQHYWTQMWTNNNRSLLLTTAVPEVNLANPSLCQLTPVSQMEVECSRIWGLKPTTQTQVGGTPHKPALPATQPLVPPATPDPKSSTRYTEQWVQWRKLLWRGPYIPKLGEEGGQGSHSFALFKSHDFPWSFPRLFLVFHDLKFSCHFRKSSLFSGILWNNLPVFYFVLANRHLQ